MEEKKHAHTQKKWHHPTPPPILSASAKAKLLCWGFHSGSTCHYQAILYLYLEHTHTFVSHVAAHYKLEIFHKKIFVFTIVIIDFKLILSVWFNCIVDII